MKTFRIFLGIIAVGFTGIFLILSNYFFDYFYYFQYGKRPNEMFFVALAFLILAVICNILLFIFVLKDKKVVTKLYCAILPITLIFSAALYYLVLDKNGSTMVRMIFGGVNDISVSSSKLQEVAYLLISLYLVILFVVIGVIVKPIKDVERAICKLQHGKIDEDIKIGSGKEFTIIEKGLNKINANYKESKVLFDRLNNEYSKYLPQQFVKELGKKSVLELSLGTNIQKEITSVFIDIRNSTKTSYTLSLSENFTFINKYLGIIGPIVRKHNGFVDKYLGDGVLAIFLRPEEAINASNEIIKTINQDSKKLGMYSTEVGIGVHTGTVVIGVIGDKKRLSATVISDSVNSASYLEKLNKVLGSNMLFTKETLNNLPKGYGLNYRYVGAFELSKDNSVSVFESLDAYDSKKRDNLSSIKSDFENGVRCFELGGGSCKKVFEKCLTKEKNDKVSLYYLKKCSEK